MKRMWISLILAFAIPNPTSAQEVAYPAQDDGNAFVVLPRPGANAYSAYAPSALPTNFCADQKTKIDWAKEHGQNLDQFPWRNLQSKQIVILGDTHDTVDIDGLLQSLAHSNSPGAANCIFFEFDSRTDPQAWLTMLKTPSDDPVVSRMRTHYSKILNQAQALRMSGFVVDGDQSQPNDVRNKAMAQNIDKLFSNGSCTHGILVVGKAHVAPESLFSGPSVADILKTKYSVATVNPITAHDEVPDVAHQMWNGLCPSATYTPNEPVIFSNSGIAGLAIEPKVSGILYGSFDYTVLAP